MEKSGIIYDFPIENIDFYCGGCAVKKRCVLEKRDVRECVKKIVDGKKFFFWGGV